MSRYHVRLFNLTPTRECEVELEGRVFAVSTPYSREFVDDLKHDIRAHHRAWSPELKLWFVAGCKRIALQQVLLQTLGDTLCPLCAEGADCSSWRGVEGWLRAWGFRDVTVDEDARERARQAEAEATSEYIRRETARQRAEEAARREREHAERVRAEEARRRRAEPPPSTGPRLPATRLEAAVVIGLPVGQLEDSAATKRAFAAAMLKAHPDHGGTDAMAKAVLRAREILMAYLAGRADQQRAQQHAGARAR